MNEPLFSSTGKHCKAKVNIIVRVVIVDLKETRQLFFFSRYQEVNNI